jgi:four helix bundle protein
MTDAQADEPRDICERTLDYALRAVRLHQAIEEERDSAGLVIARQYPRSATSIGANVEEAQAAESRSDFIHKYSIAWKEARESLYWLRLLARSGIVSLERLEDLIQESREILAIITTIVMNARKNANP